MEIGLIKDVATGNHINQLVYFLSAIDTNPEWFDPAVLSAANDWCNSELAAIARDLSQQNEKATGQGDLVVKRRNNLLIPIVPAWSDDGKQTVVESPV